MGLSMKEAMLMEIATVYSVYRIRFDRRKAGRQK
nr:MAG TPA: hypothetical protein [Caudoviricetes sp.]